MSHQSTLNELVELSVALCGPSSEATSSLQACLDDHCKLLSDGSCRVPPLGVSPADLLDSNVATPCPHPTNTCSVAEAANLHSPAHSLALSGYADVERSDAATTSLRGTDSLTSPVRTHCKVVARLPQSDIYSIGGIYKSNQLAPVLFTKSDTMLSESITGVDNSTVPARETQVLRTEREWLTLGVLREGKVDINKVKEDINGWRWKEDEWKTESLPSKEWSRQRFRNSFVFTNSLPTIVEEHDYANDVGQTVRVSRNECPSPEELDTLLYTETFPFCDEDCPLDVFDFDCP